MSLESKESSFPLFDTKGIFSRYLHGFSLVFINIDGLIQELNPSAAILLGYQIEECRGKNIDQFLQFMGIPVQNYGQVAIFEALVSRKNASVFPAQIHVIPYRDQCSMLILMDLSVRNRLREQLFQEKHLLTTVIDAIQDHVFMMDVENHFALNNESHLKFLGVKSQEDVLGRSIDSFMDSEFSKSFLSDNQTILQGKNPELNRTVEVRPGEWYEIKKTPLKDPLSQEVVGVVGLSRNVSERVKTEEKLRQVQRLESLGLLAGGIAHDFNNLLTVVVGLADTASLMVEGIDPEKPPHKDEIKDLKETLLEIRQAGQRAALLTQKLLAVGRKQLVEMRPISLSEVVLGLSKVFSGIIKSIDRSVTAIEVEYEMDPQLPMIRADRSQIEQILLNLFVNARDAIMKRMEDYPDSTYRPKINFKSYWDSVENCVILEVGDNGCGMSDEVKSKVFDPFFTTKAVGRGTGLGLASVYGILQQSKANVQIQSALGLGTTFHLSFSLWSKEEKSSVDLSTPRVAIKLEQESEVEARKILYAEDDQVIRSLVRRNLQMRGYEVIDVEDGEIAWSLYRQKPFDYALVLSDLIMPKMTGMQFIRKALELNPNQKVLCVTGYTSEETDGLPILHKPFTIQKLFQKIEEILTADLR